MGQVKGDLISRSALEKFIENGLNNPDKTKRFGHDAVEIITEVHYAPAVDAVEVVRCQDCKFCGFCGAATNLEVMGFYGYCSRGKRRGGE